MEPIIEPNRYWHMLFSQHKHARSSQNEACELHRVSRCASCDEEVTEVPRLVGFVPEEQLQGGGRKAPRDLIEILENCWNTDLLILYLYSVCIYHEYFPFCPLLISALI